MREDEESERQKGKEKEKYGNVDVKSIVKGEGRRLRAFRKPRCLAVRSERDGVRLGGRFDAIVDSFVHQVAAVRQVYEELGVPEDHKSLHSSKNLL